jgi:hypothetical protein
MPAGSVDNVAFLQTGIPWRLRLSVRDIETRNHPVTADRPYECSLAVCAAVAGTAGRPTMYATLALASINNAAA